MCTTSNFKPSGHGNRARSTAGSNGNSRAVEDLATERTHELVHTVDLFMLLDVERHVVKTRLVDAKG